MSIAKGGQAPTKPELTVEDLLAEVRAPRPGEEDSLEAPILAEKTAGRTAGLIEKAARAISSIAGESYDNMRKHKNNIRSLIAQGEISFYTFDPITKTLLPIKQLQGIVYELPHKVINVDQMMTENPFVIEYADTELGRWVSVFDMANKKVIRLIKMEVPGLIKFEGDMIRIQRDGQEDICYFYKNGSLYTRKSDFEIHGFTSMASGLMKRAIGISKKEEAVTSDYADERYFKCLEIPVIVK